MYLMRTLPFIIALSSNLGAWCMLACSPFSFILLCLFPSPTVFYRYTIEDLSNANMYLVSFSVRSCWESSSHCEQYTVLSNTRLPKSRSLPYCNWKAEETIPGKRALFSEYRNLQNLLMFSSLYINDTYIVHGRLQLIYCLENIAANKLSTY